MIELPISPEINNEDDVDSEGCQQTLLILTISPILAFRAHRCTT